jgi:two-component system nitrate/nitrite response regulator NarL
VSATPVRVLIVEDHPLYRFALEQAITCDARLTVACSTGNGEKGVDEIADVAPDVVLLDLALPGVDGFAVLSRIADWGISTPLVVLSADERGASVYRALGLGARGYLSKNLDAKEICEAVLAAARGELVLSRQLQTAVADEIRAQALTPALTERERQVLEAAARGSSTTEISRDLFISESTVKSHLSAVYGKLGVRDRAAAVARAVKRDLVSVDVSPAPSDNGRGDRV